jgi:hypothetical protein
VRSLQPHRLYGSGQIISGFPYPFHQAGWQVEGAWAKEEERNRDAPEQS